MVYPNAHRVRTQTGDRRGLIELEPIYYIVRGEGNLLDRHRHRDAKKSGAKPLVSLASFRIAVFDLG